MQFFLLKANLKVLSFVEKVQAISSYSGYMYIWPYFCYLISFSICCNLLIPATGMVRFFLFLF